MEHFYKFTFTDNHSVTHTEYYCECFPRDWFYTDEVDYCFVNTKDDTIVTESIDIFVERVVCNGMSHNGDRDSVDEFSHKIFTEIATLKKLGDFVEFRINDGWFQAEIVTPPEIDVEETIESNMWKPRGLKGVFINGKCLLEERRLHKGKWYTKTPSLEGTRALERLIKSQYPGIISIISFPNEHDVHFEIVAEGMGVIVKVLVEVFGLCADVIESEVSYGNGDTIERVKYTAVFTNF